MSGGSELTDAAVVVQETAKEVIKSFDSLMNTMIKTIMKDAADNAESPSTDSDKKLFIQPSDLSSRIMNAANFHLEKPEGRQMYLRQFEPVITRSINAISDFDALMIPMLKQCLQNSDFIKFLNSYVATLQNESDINILNKPLPFSIEEDDKDKFQEQFKVEITRFLSGLHNEVKIHLEKINPVENIYNNLRGSQCSTYGSIPEEIIERKIKLDNSQEQTSDQTSSQPSVQPSPQPSSQPSVQPAPPPSSQPSSEPPPPSSADDSDSEKDNNIGGNLRKSRNRKYLPKKNNHTRKNQ